MSIGVYFSLYKGPEADDPLVDCVEATDEIECWTDAAFYFAMHNGKGKYVIMDSISGKYRDVEIVNGYDGEYVLGERP